MVLGCDHLGGLSCWEAIFELFGQRHTRNAMDDPYLLLRTWLGRLDPVPTLDDIGLETNWACSTVELKEESAGVAEDRT
jgi:hypothetical protein